MILELLRLSWALQKTEDGIAEAFEKDHDSYVSHLRRYFQKALSEHETIFQETNIDWMTWHYKTRHPYDEFSDTKEWIEFTVPVSQRLKDRNWQAYPNKVSPYIDSFKHSVNLKGDPVIINFCKDDEVSEHSEGVLFVTKDLVSMLISQVELDKQELLSQDFVEACKKNDEKLVSEIVSKVNHWTASKPVKTEIEALSILRDVTKVTLLGLKDKVFHLPREIILIPVHFGNNENENIIGGAAILRDGTRESEDALTYLVLNSIVSNYLSSVRLKEEPNREKQIVKSETVNRVRKDLLQRATHTLLNPLDALETNISQLSKSLTAMQELFYAFKDATGELMAAFQDDDVERMMKPKKNYFRIDQFIDTLAMLYEQSYLEKDIKLDVQDDTISVVVFADKTNMYSVFDNLLKNALRFAKSRVQIIYKQKDDSKISISIIDDGPGIDEEIVPHLFKPGSGKTNASNGSRDSGYGLFLSKRVLGHHGGEIKYYRKDRKTVFEIVLPIAQDYQPKQGGA